MIPIASVLQLTPAGVAENADLAVFLFIGIFAGAHCLGMCGPLVGLYADRVSKQRSSPGRDRLTVFEVRQHTIFNGGRVIGYAAVGALFGLVGGTIFTAVDTVSTIGVGVRAVTGILVGGLVMAAGLAYVARGAGASMIDSIPVFSSVFQWVNTRLTSHVDRLAGSPGIVLLGTVHATLPCPIIYPAYLYAFAIGDPVRGGLSLAVLGIGTFPSLFAYGTVIGSISPVKRSALHRVLGLAFFVLGYLLVSHGLTLLGFTVPHIKIPYPQPLSGQ